MLAEPTLLPWIDEDSFPSNNKAMDNPLFRKLKVNKLERIKSRYKTQVAPRHSLPNVQDPDHSPQSQEFAKIYNRLSNGLHINMLAKKIQQETKHQRRAASRHRNLSTSKLTTPHPEWRSGSDYSIQRHFTPNNEGERNSSLNRSLLPTVKMAKTGAHQPSPPLRHHNKLLKIPQSYSPNLNANYTSLSGLILHANNIFGIYSKVRKNQSSESVLTSIERYVLELNGASVSQLDSLFVEEESKARCKTWVFLERVLILVLVDVQNKKIKVDRTQLKLLFHSVCDAYLSLLTTMAEQGFYIEKSTLVKLQQAQGTDLQSLKPKKLFSQSRLLITRVNSLLKNHPQWRSFFQDQLLQIPNCNINQTFYNLLEFYSLTLAQHFTVCPTPLRFLSTCPAPYVHTPPLLPFTLVMDLDETLIHYNEIQGSLLIRPHCRRFLTEMSTFFEVGIFTCAMPDYANWVLDQLKCNLSFRLFRYHTVQAGNCFLKDISRIGRDLKKTIIVDNIADNFQLHHTNGIHIKTWMGDSDDKELLKLEERLKIIIRLNPEDVRICLAETEV